MDRRGQSLGEMASSLNLIVDNMGTVPTFARKQQESVLDIIFSHRIRITRWRVDIENESLSNYIYIHFEDPTKQDCRIVSDNSRDVSERGWSFQKLDKENMSNSIL